MKTILAMGQSNAVGRGTAGAFSIDPGVLVWNNANDRSDQLQLGTQFVAPNRAAPPFVNNCNNMFVQAANYLARELDDDVRLIIVARGSQNISQWMNEVGAAGPMYTRMRAVTQAAGIASVDAFWWHQGEEDNNAPQQYATKWQHLLNAMKGVGIINDGTPIVVGETSPINPAINTILEGLAGSDARCGFARLRNLPITDRVHFSGAGLVQAGWQFARETMKLLPGYSPPAPLDFVFAAPSSSTVLLPNGVDTKVSLRAQHGNPSLISNGRFVADRSGYWRVDARGYANGQRLRLKLLDDFGSEISFVGYTGSYEPANNNAMVGGFDILDLAAGDSIWLGIQHAKGAAVTLDALSVAWWLKLSAKYLGRSV